MRLLDEHVGIAAGACANLADLVKEKTPLPKDTEDRQLLDKLAEIRAIVGLHCAGFVNIRFVGTPDLCATLRGDKYSIEVTRLGPVKGRLSAVWEQEHESAEGFTVRVTSSGALTDLLSTSIDRKLQHEAAQLPKDDSIGVIWIVGSRTYLTVGALERPTAGLERRMPITTGQAVVDAATALRKTGLYGHVRYVVLSQGERDAFWPHVPR